jgi:DNA polymerase-3 subunit epsilon
MPTPDRGLADRARLLLRAGGGRATPADLLAGLFGSSADPARWGRLVADLLEPLPDVQVCPDGSWELVAAGPPVGAGLASGVFVALATASTAADPWLGRLVSLGAVRMQAGQPAGRFEATFNPRCRLPRYVAAATGLSQAEVDEAPDFADLADALLDFLADSPLVGADVAIHLAAIEHELSRLDRPGLRNPAVELGWLAERAGLTARPNLAALAAALGLSHPRPYRPAADARIGALVAHRLLGGLSAQHAAALTQCLAEPIHELATGPLQRPDSPHAPAGPGVYLLEDAAGQVLYVGKARNLQRRLAAYHRRQLGLLRRFDGLAGAVARIRTLPARSDLEALVLEARLLRRHAPPYNTQRARRSPALFLRAELTDESASLTAAREACDDGAHYLGPFRTAAAASEALRLARRLFPGLAGRARARTAERRPIVGAALRFLLGQDSAALDRLQAEQRTLARAGDRAALAASQALLRRAIAFSLDTAALCVEPLDDRLLVLSPLPDGGIQAHLVHAGRLLVVFEAADEAAARIRAAQSIAAAGLDVPSSPDELSDERSIIFRWLCARGPEHTIIRMKDEG